MPQLLFNGMDASQPMMLNNSNSNQPYFIQMPDVKSEKLDHTPMQMDQTVSDVTKQVILPSYQQPPASQQVLCMQPDGTLLVQTLPQSVLDQQQQSHQPVLVNSDGKIAITPYGEGRKTIVLKKNRTISEKLKAAAKKPPAKKLCSRPVQQLATVMIELNDYKRMQNSILLSLSCLRSKIDIKI